MKSLALIFGVSCAALLTSCAGGNGTMAPAGPQANVYRAQQSSIAPAVKSGSQTLYVLNSAPVRSGGGDASVSVYANVGAKFLRTLDLGKYDNLYHVGFATDLLGHFYGAASFESSGLLTIYESRGARVLRTLQQSHPFGLLAIDGLENLYTSCASARVCEYADSKQHITRIFSKSFEVLAIDASNDIALWGQNGLNVYAPGKKQPYWTITNGLSSDVAAGVFDSSGDLYIASGTHSGTVAVYAPGQSSPTRAITDGISAPMALAFDTAGNLYVLNYGQPGTITVYPPGGSSPTRTITQGLDIAKAFCLDDSDNLYVANEGTSPASDPGNVTVYPAGGSSPILTLTKNIHTPVAVAVGPRTPLY